MGRYMNPGNSAFAEIAGPDYVDKTGLIDLVNRTIGSAHSLSCISRPRRSGKTWAAKMLTAYYDRSCDSHALFDARVISETALYGEYLNKFNVICLDVTEFISDIRVHGGDLKQLPLHIEQALWKDLLETGFQPNEGDSLKDFIFHIVQQEDEKPFIFIIDEWDAVIREASNNPAAQDAYLSFLRSWFKDETFTPVVVAAAYMTGILPISPMSDFHSFSIIYPGAFAPYAGFTEDEVRGICKKDHMDFAQLKKAYDGYDCWKDGTIYNPYAVMKAVSAGSCRPFWVATSSSEALTRYLCMNKKGLIETIILLISGERIPVNPSHFLNDLTHLNSTSDVLTLLIHLGYLTYDAEDGKVRIPNREIQEEFEDFLREDDLPASWVKMIERSEKLYACVLRGDAPGTSQILDEMRASSYAPHLTFDKESLLAFIRYAFFAVRSRYQDLQAITIGEETTGVVFVPKEEAIGPALVVEIGTSSGQDILPLTVRKVVPILKGYDGRTLLVSIRYDLSPCSLSCEIRETFT